MFESFRFGWAFGIALLLGVSLAQTAHATLIVAPNAQATNDGNIDDPVAGSAELRLLYVYDASQFAELSGPALLTAYTFRHDNDDAPGSSGPRTVRAQIYASTTTRPVTGLSNVFAENIGPDNTLVFDGTLTWLTANLPGPGNTRQFDIVNQLMTPYLYDPSLGNLALDLRYLSSEGSPIRFDADTSPTINRLFSFGDANAATGFVLGSGLVTQFTFQPAPAPSTFTLTILGALGLLGNARRRREQFAPPAAAQDRRVTSA